MSDDETEYDLVYPFVVCASNGGPYEDKAFVAGVRFGQIDEVLKAGVISYSVTVESALVPQLELLAMHRGCTVTPQPWSDDPYWTFATFEVGR